MKRNYCTSVACQQPTCSPSQVQDYYGAMKPLLGHQVYDHVMDAYHDVPRDYPFDKSGRIKFREFETSIRDENAIARHVIPS